MNDDTKISDKLMRLNALIKKGNEFLEQQNYKEALNTYDEVLNEEPRFFAALIGKIKVYQELNQWQNVITCCDKVLEINPKHSSALEHKIRSLYALEKIDETLELAKQAQKDYPDNEIIEQFINASLEKKEKREKPIIEEIKIKEVDKSIYEKPTEEKPTLEQEITEETTETSSHLIFKGNEFLNQENYKEALSTFDRVTAQDPRYIDALIGKMKVYRELYQWQNVINCGEKILEINPKERIALEHKIWSLYALDKVDEALELSKQAQKYYPDNESIQQCINAILEKKGKKESYIPKEPREIKPQPDISEMKKTNKFLIGAVYAYLIIVIVVFLVIDLIFFIKLNFNTRLLIQIGLYSCLLGSFLILIYFDEHTNLRELGISTDNLLNSTLIGIFVSSGFVITALLFWIGPIITDILTILIIGFLTILIGIVEEFFFRGYIQSKARKSTRKMIAILLTGLFFAILHIPKYFIIPFTSNNIYMFASITATVQSLIILGLLFGFIRENTKNIIGPIIAHTTWDFYLLIYTPMTVFQLYTIPRPQYYTMFQGIASMAMLGTFLIAWAISSALKVNILEDPREFGMEIEAINSKIQKYEKKKDKLQYQVSYYTRRQEYLGHSNYYAYRNLEFKKRRLECKIDYFDTLKSLFSDLSERITLENYTELMNYKENELKTMKRNLNNSIKDVIRSTLVPKPAMPKIPRSNQYGYNVIPLYSIIRNLEQKKQEILRKFEYYSFKLEMVQNKNPRHARELELKKDKMRYKIEYYDRLIDTYRDVAETISNSNSREKRKLIYDEKRMAKLELNEKMRNANLKYYRRY
ncbi:MAG: type II CAAX prenyl endopeptidase Rce1 family protein [Promethearchaeota archaeon]